MTTLIKNKTKCITDIKGSNKICSLTEHVKLLKDYLYYSGITCDCLNKLSDDKIIELIKKKYNLKHEYEIYETSDIIKIIGKKQSFNILKNIFVNKGPNDSTALLNNLDIDNLCKKWMEHTNQFNKKYYHIPFQMIDFMDYKNPLRDLDIEKLIKNGYDCFSCVLNTDISTGNGKHWFCIYGEIKNNNVTIEHFNSSGMPIRISVLKWLEKQIIELKLKDYNAKYIYVNENKQIQYSNTECGVWCLIYILSRLLNKPNNWFIKVDMLDKTITEYRDYIFR